MRSVRRLHAFTAIGLLILIAAAPHNLEKRAPSRPAPDGYPKIEWNDNRVAAGTLRDGVLSLRLEVRRGLWHVLGDEEPGAEVLAFAEVGKPLQVPGPLIRVPLGTEIQVSVSNPLDTTLVVQGLSPRRVETLDSLVVPSGSTRGVRFTADAEGTYFYLGRMDGSPTAVRPFESNVLSGAFVVDPPGAASPARDRVLLIQMWFDGVLENGRPDLSREFLVINGRPWPLTERLTYEMGDSIRWRLINASDDIHPMHLHGFYYRVDARGDLARDSIYWLAQRRLAVTERMAPFTTMNMVWSPDRPGGWIFHCHMSVHVLYNPSLRPDHESADERARHLLLGDHDGDPNQHVLHGMGGLMMGMYVRPPAGWEPHEPQRRRLRLFVQSDSIPADSASDELQLAAPDRRRFAYVLQQGEREPAPDSVRLPGSPIVLWKGEPTAINVINRSGEPTQVHWHGLEIESYFDGVTGFGGYPDRLTPVIMPGDSFEIRITPPRAGSFMYHTHVSDLRQQSAGLYGAFIVLEEGEEWDPTIDRVFMIGLSPSEPGVHLNGSRAPEPLELEVGTTYRMRLMNITLFNGNAKVWLTRDGAPVRWRLISKDGWDVHPHQRKLLPAEQTVSVGETFDFEYTPQEPAELHLEVRSGGGRLFVDQLIRIVDSKGDGD